MCDQSEMLQDMEVDFTLIVGVEIVTWLCYDGIGSCHPHQSTDSGCVVKYGFAACKIHLYTLIEVISVTVDWFYIIFHPFCVMMKRINCNVSIL